VNNIDKKDLRPAIDEAVNTANKAAAEPRKGKLFGLSGRNKGKTGKK
jgi:hypothetical protein